MLTASSLLSDFHLNPSVLPAPPCRGRSAAVPAIGELQSAAPRGRIDELHRAVSKALRRRRLFQLSPLFPWQIPGHVRARMQHKHKQARRRRRRALEVASFVPGHVRNRGATPRSWTALCSKKNKVATPLGTDPMSVVFDGAHAARSRRGKHRHHPHRPPRFRNRGATPWAWTALCSKKNKVATPFHSNRMERRRHVAPFLGSHAANHASKLKEAEVATANTDRGRAPGLVPAFLVAPTKCFRTARPAGRAPDGRAVPHAPM